MNLDDLRQKAEELEAHHRRLMVLAELVAGGPPNPTEVLNILTMAARYRMEWRTVNLAIAGDELALADAAEQQRRNNDAAQRVIRDQWLRRASESRRRQAERAKANQPVFHPIGSKQERQLLRTLAGPRDGWRFSIENDSGLPLPVVSSVKPSDTHGELSTVVSHRARAMDMWAPWQRVRRSRRYEGYEDTR
jgi:hypothetical protein